MAKVITTKRLEGGIDKAHDYIRTHILFPSSLLGLIAMVVGVLGLLYQLIMGTYRWETFSFSSGLLLLGVIIRLGSDEIPKIYSSRISEHFFQVDMRTSERSAIIPEDEKIRLRRSQLNIGVAGSFLFSIYWEYRRLSDYRWPVYTRGLSMDFQRLPCPGQDFFGQKCFFGKG